HKALPVKIESCFGVLESMKSQTPSTNQQTAARGERLLKPPQGAAQSRVLWVRILYLHLGG
ncbi:MAG: hypothetical protein WBG91_12435, partial [Syntrophobacteria bacterium]